MRDIPTTCRSPSRGFNPTGPAAAGRLRASALMAQQGLEDIAFEAVGFADTVPIATNDTMGTIAKRRIEIRMLTFNKKSMSRYMPKERNYRKGERKNARNARKLPLWQHFRIWQFYGFFCFIVGSGHRDEDLYQEQVTRLLRRGYKLRLKPTIRQQPRT